MSKKRIKKDRLAGFLSKKTKKKIKKKSIPTVQLTIISGRKKNLFEKNSQNCAQAFFSGYRMKIKNIEKKRIRI